MDAIANHNPKDSKTFLIRLGGVSTSSKKGTKRGIQTPTEGRRGGGREALEELSRNPAFIKVQEQRRKMRPGYDLAKDLCNSMGFKEGIPLVSPPANGYEIVTGNDIYAALDLFAEKNPKCGIENICIVIECCNGAAMQTDLFQLHKDNPIRIGGKNGRVVELSGLATPHDLPGDRLAFLTHALRCCWFENGSFPGAEGMEVVALRAMKDMILHLDFYGFDEGSDFVDYNAVDLVLGFPRPKF